MLLGENDEVVRERQLRELIAIVRRFGVVQVLPE